MAAGARVGERRDLRVRLAGTLVEAFAEHHAVARDHAADPGVGRGRLESARGERERPRHEAAIGVGAVVHGVPFALRVLTFAPVPVLRARIRAPAPVTSATASAASRLP